MVAVGAVGCLFDGGGVMARWLAAWAVGSVALTWWCVRHAFDEGVD